MIAPKLFSKLLDLDARATDSIEYEVEFNRLADEVRWPFNASKEQLADWDAAHTWR